jgi:hypothetical protein
VNSFDLADVLFEYSKAVRHSLISIECLRDVPGVNPEEVNALAESMLKAHAATTAYIATMIVASSSANHDLKLKCARYAGS